LTLIDSCWLWQTKTRANERQCDPNWDLQHRGEAHLAVLVWADNIFTFATTLGGACKRMDHIADFLRDKWALALKPSSLELLLPKGHLDHAAPAGWKKVQQMDALGHRLDWSADTKPCVARTLSFAWAAFWRNYGMVSETMGLKNRCKLFQRAVAPVFKFRASRWIWQTTVAQNLHRQQSRVLGTLLKIHRNPDETWKSFEHRKKVLLTKHKVRRWDEEWQQLVLAWNGHLDRHADLFATKIRAAAVAQSQVNQWRRTIGMCTGNARSLGTRRVSGQPRRTLDGLSQLQDASSRT
jgi:hypothetical protein